MLQTYNDDGVIDTYTYGLQRIDSKGEINEIYLYDGRGSVVGSVSEDVMTSYAYTAYGDLMPDSPTPNVFGYNAEATDFTTGIQYLRARYYDATINSFFQEDDYRGDFTNPASMNRYAYVHGNPVMGIDPSGYFYYMGNQQVSSYTYTPPKTTTSIMKKVEEYAVEPDGTKPFSVPDLPFKSNIPPLSNYTNENGGGSLEKPKADYPADIEEEGYALCSEIIIERGGEDAGLEILINSNEFEELKELANGRYGASVLMGEYIMEKYEEDLIDARTEYGIASEVYAHDYLLYKYSGESEVGVLNSKHAGDEVVEGVFESAKVLNVIFENDAVAGRAEQMSGLMKENKSEWNEFIMKSGSNLYVPIERFDVFRENLNNLEGIDISGALIND